MNSVATAGINGTVSDVDGEGLPGAVVEALDETNNIRREVVTREDGRYMFRDLPVDGPYELTVTMTGFKTAKKNNIFLKLGENLRIDFTLQVASVEESLL